MRSLDGVAASGRTTGDAAGPGPLRRHRPAAVSARAGPDGFQRHHVVHTRLGGRHGLPDVLRQATRRGRGNPAADGGVARTGPSRAADGVCVALAVACRAGSRIGGQRVGNHACPGGVRGRRGKPAAGIDGLPFRAAVGAGLGHAAPAFPLGDGGSLCNAADAGGHGGRHGRVCEQCGRLLQSAACHPRAQHPAAGDAVPVADASGSPGTGRAPVGRDAAGSGHRPAQPQGPARARLAPPGAYRAGLPAARSDRHAGGRLRAGYPGTGDGRHCTPSAGSGGNLLRGHRAVRVAAPARGRSGPVGARGRARRARRDRCRRPADPAAALPGRGRIQRHARAGGGPRGGDRLAPGLRGAPSRRAAAPVSRCGPQSRAPEPAPPTPRCDGGPRQSPQRARRPVLPADPRVGGRDRRRSARAHGRGAVPAVGRTGRDHGAGAVHGAAGGRGSGCRAGPGRGARAVPPAAQIARRPAALPGDRDQPDRSEPGFDELPGGAAHAAGRFAAADERLVFRSHRDSGHLQHRRRQPPAGGPARAGVPHRHRRLRHRNAELRAPARTAR